MSHAKSGPAGYLQLVLNLYYDTQTYHYMTVGQSPNNTQNSMSKCNFQLHLCRFDHNHVFLEYIHQYLHTGDHCLRGNSQTYKNIDNFQSHLSIFDHIHQYVQHIHQYLQGYIISIATGHLHCDQTKIHHHINVHHLLTHNQNNRSKYSFQLHWCMSEHSQLHLQHIHQYHYTHSCYLTNDSQHHKSKNSCQYHLCISAHIYAYLQCIH